MAGDHWNQSHLSKIENLSGESKLKENFKYLALFAVLEDHPAYLGVP